uniref:Uncharacterized protein n=1 Tax=Ditylenchus dipsaci TaxID=166011 RepID=A0A915E157_9BILA
MLLPSILCQETVQQQPDMMGIAQKLLANVGSFLAIQGVQQGNTDSFRRSEPSSQPTEKTATDSLNDAARPTSGQEPLYVDGQQIFNEDLILGHIFGKKETGPRHSEHSGRPHRHHRYMPSSYEDEDNRYESYRLTRPWKGRTNPLHPMLLTTTLTPTTTGHYYQSNYYNYICRGLENQYICGKTCKKDSVSKYALKILLDYVLDLVSAKKMLKETEYANFVLSIGVNAAGSLTNYRLQGNIYQAEDDQLIIRLKDFHDSVVDIPVCALKAGLKKNSTAYQYVVLVESSSCNEAMLIVQDPALFLKQTDSELTKFLQHKISTEEMNPMEIVQHADTC